MAEKEERVEPEEEEEHEAEEKDAREAAPSLLEGISSFNKSKLKKARTVVYSNPVVRQSRNFVAAPNAEEVKEYYDTEEELDKKVAQFLQLLKAKKYFVCYTGAGISTAANIPDYRGPKGVWTLKAQGKSPEMTITLAQAVPTYSHMALVALAKSGFCKFVVSTNVDGLHRRSGLSADQVAELHGNIYREVCSGCKKEYLRPFDVNKNKRGRYTGRLCQDESCRKRLQDSIINFGEMLPQHELDKARKHSRKADLTLVIGSSMRVQPACHLPSLSYKTVPEAAFCIVNLQKTIFDKDVEGSGGVRIHSKCDDFFRKLMEKLKIPVEDFKLETEVELEALKEELVVDDKFDQVQTNTNLFGKRAMYMADGDGPPPHVLAAILSGGITLRHIEVTDANKKRTNNKVPDEPKED
eukprot:TRINITY_DN9468_c0_g1_i1.p1 TRINITY_DN9468_c0_g1~~TRINITY_DN9468_c0_g1_i1.p1  ORF type:complete len:411 (+),score=77.32 TRINITY_DN9468_c0_g1_i1:81-1313(+)